MTEQELKEIRKRLEAATPGPWISAKEYSFVVNEEGTIICGDTGFRDRIFIKNAPEDIRRLLDEVERLREKDRKFIDWLYKKREEKRKSAQNSYDAVAGTLFEVEAEMVDEVIQKLSSE